MKKILEMFYLSVMILMFPQVHEIIAQNPIYRTPEELRKASEPFMKLYKEVPLDTPVAKPIPYPDIDTDRLFVVEYLNSKDSDMQNAAVDILADFVRYNRWIRASVLEEYLSRKYPLNIRVVAAAHCIVNYRILEEMKSKKQSELIEESDRLVKVLLEFILDITATKEEIPNLGIINISLRFGRMGMRSLEPDIEATFLKKLNLSALVDQYKSPKQLLEICEPFMKHYISSSPGSPLPLEADSDDDRVFIVDFLDSKDQVMRDTAVDIISEMAKFGRHIRASAFKKYLSQEYPLNIRITAMLMTRQRYKSNRERAEESKLFTEFQKDNKSKKISYSDFLRELSEKNREADIEIKKIYGDILNHLAENPEAFKKIDIVAYNINFEDVQMVKPENALRLASQFLKAMKNKPKGYNAQILSNIAYFPPEIACEAYLDWYASEEDAASRDLFFQNFTRITRGEGEKKILQLKSVLDLAAQDKDEKIAGKAKVILKRINE